MAFNKGTVGKVAEGVAVAVSVALGSGAPRADWIRPAVTTAVDREVEVNISTDVKFESDLYERSNQDD
jgi:hypothetical protein